MRTHLSLSESGEYRFFLIQHRWRGEGAYAGWSGGTNMHWGIESSKIAREHNPYPSGEFATREEAEAFLREWVPTVVSHQSVDFRVAEVVARIDVTEHAVVEGPRVCGVWSKFGYCQLAPKHRRPHDSSRWKAKDQLVENT